ncbi:MAG: hypothetical protein HF981_04130 [Desulfobacteraceae bacterium]|nr:hypothetical protein [Desulfobacteraceae bacterium]MBC2749553.1 hypothetical protein [Desulfobacteraceae bacterium]
MNAEQINPTMSRPIHPPQRGFARSRLYNFGLTMVIMGASFVLYYMGLFGTVDGPLTPANMGKALSGLGVTQRHVIIMLLSLLIGAVSWNWLFNLTSAMIGARMTCTAAGKDGNEYCGLPAKRIRRVSRRSGREVITYVCDDGHRRSEAHFHPLKKGAVSNTVWMACLAFVIIAFCGV